MSFHFLALCVEIIFGQHCTYLSPRNTEVNSLIWICNKFCSGSATFMLHFILLCNKRLYISAAYFHHRIQKLHYKLSRAKIHFFFFKLLHCQITLSLHLNCCIRNLQITIYGYLTVKANCDLSKLKTDWMPPLCHSSHLRVGCCWCSLLNGGNHTCVSRNVWTAVSWRFQSLRSQMGCSHSCPVCPCRWKHILWKEEEQCHGGES